MEPDIYRERIKMNKRVVWFAMLAGFVCTMSAKASFTMSDLSFWAGSGPNRSVLVVDWLDPVNGQQDFSVAWGYRFSGAATAQDMFLAIVAADPRLSAVGLDTGFISYIGYDMDLNGSDDYSHPGWVDPNFWNQMECDGASPFFDGSWSAGMGIATHNLADNSWSGWQYNSWGNANPREPISAVPEAGSAVLVLLGLGITTLVRRVRMSRTLAK
jgi:hypothetical protein